MGRPALLLLLLSTVFAALPGHRADAKAVRRTRTVIYAITYDEGIEVRTDFPPPSAVKQNGGPLTSKQRQALRKPGESTYRADISDLSLAMYVTIYLDEPNAEIGPGKKPLARHYPPVYCRVHHNRLSQRNLVLYQVAPGRSETILIRDRGTERGIPLPGVRLKMIVVHSYYPDLSGRLRR